MSVAADRKDVPKEVAEAVDHLAEVVSRHALVEPLDGDSPSLLSAIRRANDRLDLVAPTVLNLVAANIRSSRLWEAEVERMRDGKPSSRSSDPDSLRPTDEGDRS